jgi:hypothetical protein
VFSVVIAFFLIFELHQLAPKDLLDRSDRETPVDETDGELDYGPTFQ